MITIELVRCDGFLVGRTLSDRWNLEAVGTAPLRDSRNQADVKRLRRILAAEYGPGAFAVKVVKDEFRRYATETERDNLGPGNVNRLSAPFGVKVVPDAWHAAEPAPVRHHYNAM